MAIYRFSVKVHRAYRPTSVQNGDIRKGPNSEYLLSKVNFPAKSAI